MFGEDRAVNGGGEDNAPALLQPDEMLGPAGVIWRAARPGDGHQPAAFRETGERRRDMAKGGARHLAIDMASAEKGGFISTTLGVTPTSR